MDIRGEVTAGRDVFMDVNVVLEGRRCNLGDGVTHRAAAVVIKNSKLGRGVRVEPHTVVEGAEVAADCSFGPFARIRPGTELAEGVKIGNFVETKKAVLGKWHQGQSSHLSRATRRSGAECNVGAGTITCNYDGVNKHHTTIGDDVFVGSNSTLVAPVEMEDGAFVAAGSTITQSRGPGKLAALESAAAGSATSRAGVGRTKGKRTRSSRHVRYRWCGSRP